jgi:hypothetical protein
VAGFFGMASASEEAASTQLSTPIEGGTPETPLLIEAGNPGPEPAVPTEDELLAGVRVLLQDTDLQQMSLGKLRRKLARHLGLRKEGLDDRADEVRELAKRAIAVAAAPVSPADAMATMLAGLGEEDTAAKQLVYLVTISRVLPETLAATDLVDVSGFSRATIAEYVRHAFNEPAVTSAGGRPRTRDGIVKKTVVVRELHASGEIHFHVAVVLHSARTFLPVKRSLRGTYKLATHWSTSHTQWWSALRYCIFPSVTKPEVDEEPFQWASDGKEFDLHAESQRPWTATMWKRRREAAEQSAAATGGASKRTRFAKLDLTALILDKGLKSRADVLEYSQDHGNESMQNFVHNHQRQLKDFIQDAEEWGNARAEAKADRETDRDLVCRTAASDCPHGLSCSYRKAAEMLFGVNAATLSKENLAASLRAVILTGPSKTTRTPLIIGPTNTGKTTLILPFDNLFGSRRVFHKPALGSKFALRNIMKEKRFLLWDDYRPVDYGQETIEVPTFLSLFNGMPFEVQVSQSFNDGNIDFEWRRGAVLTAKEKDLWKPYGVVSDEDITHIQGRVEVFRCTAKVPTLKDTVPCPCCMCHWILDGAQAFDAKQALNALAPSRLPSTIVGPARESVVPGPVLAGLAELAVEAKIALERMAPFEFELLSLGAVHVGEVSAAEWQSLQSWAVLRQFEQRRLLAALR